MRVQADPVETSASQPAAQLASPACDARAGDAPLPLDDVIAEIAARRGEFESKGHVPRDVIAMLKRAGIYRAGTPSRFGGDALAPAIFLDMIERIAVADGSAAWVASFGSSNAYLAALPLQTQALLYANGPDQVFAGGLFPVQSAAAVAGGYRVNGTWKFASGCMGADWLGVGISVPEASDAARGGKPRVAVFRPEQVEIVENWKVVGMQGTGSHDLRVVDGLVEEGWTFVRGAAPLVEEPLYRYPTIAYAAQVLAVVNLGLARAALDVLNGMGGGRKAFTGAPQLADRAYFRIGLGKAETKLRACRGFFYETTQSVWASILTGAPVTPEQVNLLRLSATEAAQAGADIVQEAYRLAGIAAIYQSHPLQRLVRDSLVVTQHAFLGQGNYEAAGAVFAGRTPFPGYL
ncbi:MAG: acyl-CoA dehydrogenase family protein [Janthinobacterium lividum]